MTTTTTPNMKLVLPVPGSEPGPAWASEQVTALGLVDAHDHSAGKGSKVTQAGLNITDDLSLASKGLVDVGFVRLVEGAPEPAAYAPVLYVDFNGDLHFVDGSIRDVQLTALGALNLTGTRGFNGQYATDPSFPSAFYGTAARRYTFTSDGASPAQVRLGSLLVGVLSTAIAAAVADNDGTHTVAVNTTAAVTITLPLAANNPGRQLTIKDSTGGAATHNVTVARTSTDTIDGATSATIGANRGVLRLVSDGVLQWMVV